VRWLTFLAFAIIFGAIFYALEPSGVNEFFADLFHRTRGTVVNTGVQVSGTLSLEAATVSVGGQSLRVQVADTDAKRSRGLSGRTFLDADRGMLFVFPKPDRYAFTMRDMRFALDFIWIAGDRVVGVTENVPAPQVNATPVRVEPPQPVDAVVEVNAGSVARWKISAGQTFLRSD
jgi:uncharacterized membrane protein (UPF0127 family)